MVLENRLLECE